MTRQTTTRNKQKTFETFIQIPDYEFQERITTSLYPSEISFIKDEKGWSFNDLIRDGVKARIIEKEKMRSLEKRIEVIEKILIKQNKNNAQIIEILK